MCAVQGNRGSYRENRIGHIDILHGQHAALLALNLVVEWKRNLVAHGDAREEK